MITINGKKRTLPKEASIALLLEELQLNHQPCAVEINKKLIPHQKHSKQAIKDGDVIEIVTIVGGG